MKNVGIARVVGEVVPARREIHVGRIKGEVVGVGQVHRPAGCVERAHHGPYGVLSCIALGPHIDFIAYHRTQSRDVELGSVYNGRDQCVGVDTDRTVHNGPGGVKTVGGRPGDVCGGAGDVGGHHLLGLPAGLGEDGKVVDGGRRVLPVGIAANPSEIEPFGGARPGGVQCVGSGLPRAVAVQFGEQRGGVGRIVVGVREVHGLGVAEIDGQVGVVASHGAPVERQGVFRGRVEIDVAVSPAHPREVDIVLVVGARVVGYVQAVAAVHIMIDRVADEPFIGAVGGDFPTIVYHGILEVTKIGYVCRGGRHCVECHHPPGAVIRGTAAGAHVAVVNHIGRQAGQGGGVGRHNGGRGVVNVETGWTVGDFPFGLCSAEVAPMETDECAVQVVNGRNRRNAGDAGYREMESSRGCSVVGFQLDGQRPCRGNGAGQILVGGHIAVLVKEHIAAGSCAVENT